MAIFSIKIIKNVCFVLDACIASGLNVCGEFLISLEYRHSKGKGKSFCVFVGIFNKGGSQQYKGAFELERQGKSLISPLVLTQNMVKLSVVGFYLRPVGGGHGHQGKGFNHCSVNIKVV